MGNVEYMGLGEELAGRRVRGAISRADEFDEALQGVSAGAPGSTAGERRGASRRAALVDQQP